MAKRKDCYTDEQKDEIIAHVLIQVASGRFISRVLREDEYTESGVKMCGHTTFWKWMIVEGTPELTDKLARAREKGIEAILDEIGEIADDGTNDFVPKVKDGEIVGHELDREHVLRSKLRIETRIKLAQMLNPRKYGPKLDLTSGGEKIGRAERLDQQRQYALKKLAEERGEG